MSETCTCATPHEEKPGVCWCGRFIAAESPESRGERPEDAWKRCPEHGPHCGGAHCCCADKHVSLLPQRTPAVPERTERQRLFRYNCGTPPNDAHAPDEALADRFFERIGLPDALVEDFGGDEIVIRVHRDEYEAAIGASTPTRSERDA